VSSALVKLPHNSLIGNTSSPSTAGTFLLQNGRARGDSTPLSPNTNITRKILERVRREASCCGAANTAYIYLIYEEDQIEGPVSLLGGGITGLTHSG